MADAADSKSVTLKSVRVQVPPPARKKSLENQRSQGFSFCYATISFFYTLSIRFCILSELSFNIA